jgi:hypothetical protein
MELGISDDNCKIVCQEKGFVNRAIFTVWAEEIFLPHVARTRESLGYPGYGYLLIDGFSGHDSERFLDGCLYHGIVPVFLPAHSSDQTQPLDLVTFGLAKRVFSRASRAPELNMQSSNIANIMKALRHATDPMSVMGAFRRAGILGEYSRDHDALIARVEPDRAAKVRDPCKVRREVMEYENGGEEVMEYEPGGEEVLDQE